MKYRNDIATPAGRPASAYRSVLQKPGRKNLAMRRMKNAVRIAMPSKILIAWNANFAGVFGGGGFASSTLVAGSDTSKGGSFASFFAIVLMFYDGIKNVHAGTRRNGVNQKAMTETSPPRMQCRNTRDYSETMYILIWVFSGCSIYLRRRVSDIRVTLIRACVERGKKIRNA